MWAWHLNNFLFLFVFFKKILGRGSTELGHAIEHGEAVDFGNECLMMLGMHIT